MSETATEQNQAQYVRARRDVTVQKDDGTHDVVSKGQVVSTDGMSAAYLEQLGTDGSWTANLFDSATQEDFEADQADRLVFEQKDFMRDHLNEFGNIVLPGPDEIAAINEGELQVQPRPAPIIPIHHTSSATVTGGPEADELLNATVGSSKAVESDEDVSLEDGKTPLQEAIEEGDTNTEGTEPDDGTAHDPTQETEGDTAGGSETQS
jgi:hypothetical protein